MVSLALLMGLIGAIIATIIGFLIVGELTDAINCDEIVYEATKLECEKATSTAWVVIAILPIALFFALFQIFGGIGGGDEFKVEDKPTQNLYGSATETKKQRQKRKQAKVDIQLEQYDDKVVHSFLTNWFRGKKEQ